MKYYKRLKIYKASNVSFNPETIEAYSYQWWKFVAKINGKVIFNNYNYSLSTGKHQSKVRSVMRELGINIDLELPFPKGIDTNPDTCIRYLEYKRNALIEQINKPRTLAKKNRERAEQAMFIQKQIMLAQAYIR